MPVGPTRHRRTGWYYGPVGTVLDASAKALPPVLDSRALTARRKLGVSVVFVVGLAIAYIGAAAITEF